MTPAIASARKSLGQYKPLVVLADGKTKVVEQAHERRPQYDPAARRYFRENKMARGTTYVNREDAIAAAQRYIDARRDEAVASYRKFEESAPIHLREKLLVSVKREVEFWGGSI